MAKKILIVDDDPDIRDFLSTLLSDNGYETRTAENAAMALKALEVEKPDLITLDLEMPNEWGPRFYRKYTQEPEFKDIPVIVISGLSGIHLAIRKAVATIQKPFDPEVVIETVKKAIG